VQCESGTRSGGSPKRRGCAVVPRVLVMAQVFARFIAGRLMLPVTGTGGIYRPGLCSALHDFGAVPRTLLWTIESGSVNVDARPRGCPGLRVCWAPA